MVENFILKAQSVEPPVSEINLDLAVELVFGTEGNNVADECSTPFHVDSGTPYGHGLCRHRNRHRGRLMSSGSDQKELADATWEVGGAAMMQATKITKLLAAKHAAPAPAAAVMSGTVMLPSVGGTSEEALMLDKNLAEHGCATAKKGKGNAFRH